MKRWVWAVFPTLALWSAVWSGVAFWLDSVYADPFYFGFGVFWAACAVLTVVVMGLFVWADRAARAERRRPKEREPGRKKQRGDRHR